METPGPQHLRLSLAFALSLCFTGLASAQQCPAILAPSDVFKSITYDYSASPFVEIFQHLDESIPTFVKNNDIASYAVSIVHRDRTIYTTGLTTTRFRIGSLTKIFTSLGSLILRERGQLSLEDPVKKFLPKFSIINPYGEHDITLRELMGHVSGLPRDLCNYFSECATEESEILELVSHMQLTTPPWSNMPAYSNLGYALLGHAWEKVTSPTKSWAHWVMDEIVKPLGMDSTGTNVSNVILAPAVFPAEPIGWIAPAGEMYSTSDDLAKLLAFLLTAEPPLISTITMREWMHPVVLFPDDEAGFALPWELVKLTVDSPSFIMSKSGIIGGFNSYLAFDPTTQLGISVLTSARHANASASAPIVLGNSILSTLITALEALNNNIIAAAYAGVYICKPTPPVEGPTLNKTLQILGGSISVSSSPTLGLLAKVNVSMLEDGQTISVDLDSTLLLKNATERSFWINSGPGCESYALNLGIFPDLYSPNTQGSIFSFVLFFDLQAHTISWPSAGAFCSRA